MKPDLSHETEVVPAFYDVDSMDIVWHGNYVKFMEVARCELLAKFGYDYPRMRASGYAWPVVDMRLKYVRSAEFGQRLIVRSEIVEWENRLRITYRIRDAASGRKLTEASTVQVAVDMASGEMQYLCPPVLWERLGVTP